MQSINRNTVCLEGLVLEHRGKILQYPTSWSMHQLLFHSTFCGFPENKHLCPKEAQRHKHPAFMNFSLQLCGLSVNTIVTNELGTNV